MLYQKLLHGHKQLQSYCVKKSLFIKFSGLNEYMIVEIFYHLRNIFSQEIHVEGPLDKINPEWPGCILKQQNYAGVGKY